MVQYTKEYYIKDNVICNCYVNAPEIELPRDIIGIRYNAFCYHHNLHRIVIPEGVRFIEASAFIGCFRLEEVVLPSTLRRIGGHCFSDCTALKQISLPDALNQIGYRAFDGTALEQIDLPLRLTRCPDESFMDCRNLSRITWPYKNGSLQEWGTKALAGALSHEDLRIYAPRQKNLDGLPIRIRDAALRGFAEQYLKGTLPGRFPQKAWLRALGEKVSEGGTLNGMEIVIACLEGILPPERLPDAVATIQVEGDAALTARVLTLQNRMVGASGDADLGRAYQDVFGCPVPA